MHVSRWAFTLRYTIIVQKKIENKDSCLIFLSSRLITIVDKHDKLDMKHYSTFDSLLLNIGYIKKPHKIQHLCKNDRLLSKKC